jgi:hypothetical protein
MICSLEREATDNPAYFFNGFLDEIRINKATAAWTSNFTPPTARYPE